MRRGMNGLAIQVQETLRRDPHGGHLFVFRGKRGDLIKVLWHDGQGMCLFAKRLEQGTFRWPKIEDGTMRLTPSQLAALIEGLDWTRVREVEVRVPQATQSSLRHGDSRRRLTCRKLWRRVQSALDRAA